MKVGEILFQIKENRFLNFIKYHLFSQKDFILFIIPFLTFMFLLFIFFPGIITSDGCGQWAQVTNNSINNSHPFFSTYFMYILSKIWNSPAIVMVYQILFFSGLWSFICNYTRKDKKDFKIQIFYTMIMCLIPIFSIYSITLWKDVLYSYYLMAIIFLIYIGIKEKFQYKYSSIVFISLFLTLVFSYRHNGIIVAILLLITFIILLFKYKNNYKKILLLIICFVLFNGIIAIPKKQYLSKIQNNNENSISTLDGFMLWIYGSLIKNDKISDDDLKILNNVIPIEKWKEIYDPFLINSTSFEKKDEKYFIEHREEIIDMFKKYTIKNPNTVFIHYMKSDSLLWSPIPIGYVYSYEFTEWGPIYRFDNAKIYGFERKIPEINGLKNVVEYYISGSNKKPIRVVLYQPGLIMYFAIALIIGLMIKFKQKKYLLLSLPMIYNICSLVLINPAQDLRYVYINYLTLLFVGLLVLLNYKKHDKVFNRMFIGFIVSCIFVVVFAFLYK